MKKLLVLVITTAMVLSMNNLVFAATKTATATVSATVPSATLSITLGTDTGCSAPDATKITLTQDTKYPSFMIAPNRFDMDPPNNKNWHYAQISANKKWKLEIQGTDLTGAPGTIAISNFRYWYAGTYAGYNQVTTTPLETPDDPGWTPNQIAKTPNWKEIFSCTSSVIGAKSYLSYQLDIGSVPTAGAYSGTITYQVTDAMV